MSKNPIIIKLGEGSIEYLAKVKQYLDIILAGWQVESPMTELATVTIGYPDNYNNSYKAGDCGIDNIFKDKDGPIRFANELKLIAAQIWAEEGERYGQ